MQTYDFELKIFTKKKERKSKENILKGKFLET